MPRMKDVHALLTRSVDNCLRYTIGSSGELLNELEKTSELKKEKISARVKGIYIRP